MSSSTPEPNQAPESLQEVLDLLKSKAKELLFCTAQRVPALQQEIQKLRIVAALYREMMPNALPDRDLYKEMNLLNRMMTGKDLEVEAERRQAEEDADRATERLKKNYGLNPQSANRIARAITAVVGGKNDGIDESEPQPIKPDALH